MSRPARSSTLLSARRELELGRAMSEARLVVAELLRRLPTRLRRELLGGGPPSLNGARSWNLGQLRALDDRLFRLAGRIPSPRRERLLHDVREQVERFEAARTELVVANLRLVVHLARRFGRNRLPLPDLIQDGNVGLIHAVEKFEFERGHRFSTYAYWWIKQAIDRAVMDKKRMIRIPVHLEEKRKRLLRIAGRLRQDLGRRPEPLEISRRANVPLSAVEHLLCLPRHVDTHDSFSLLSDPPDPMQNVPQAGVPTPAERLQAREIKEHVERLLRTLDAREEEIVRLRFGIGRDRSHTLQEIGKRVRLSRERARQIAAAALTKLRAGAAGLPTS